MPFVLPPQAESELDHFPSLRDPYRAASKGLVHSGAQAAARPEAKRLQDLHALEQHPLRQAFSLLLGYAASLVGAKKSLLSAYTLSTVPVEQLQRWVQFRCMESFYLELQRASREAERVLGISSSSFHLLQEFHSGELRWVQVSQKVAALVAEVRGISLQYGYDEIHYIQSLLNSMYAFSQQLPGLEAKLRTAQEPDADVGFRTLEITSVEKKIREEMARLPANFAAADLKREVLARLSQDIPHPEAYKKVLGVAFELMQSSPQDKVKKKAIYDLAVRSYFGSAAAS